MAYQRDYILRIIEEFFVFLGKILKLKSEKQYDQAFVLVDEAARNFVKTDLEKAVNDKTYLNELLLNKKLTFDQLNILAELLKVKADLYKETNLLFSAVSHYETSLAIFEYVQTESKNFSLEISNKLEDIRTILNAIQK